MLTGFLFLVCAGLGWSITGVVLSYTARKGIRVLLMLAPQMLISLCLALGFLPDYAALSRASVADIWPVSALLS